MIIMFMLHQSWVQYVKLHAYNLVELNFENAHLRDYNAWFSSNRGPVRGIARL